MNFKEVKDLLFSIGRIEQILHEQQLMLPWNGTYHYMDELDIAKISACNIRFSFNHDFWACIVSLLCRSP